MYIQGNYSYINGNTARRGATGNRAGYGLRIGAGVTAAVVGLNDLYDSGMTGEYLDSGTGTRRIRTSDIEDSAITSAKIADGTIASADLAANAVVTAPVAILPTISQTTTSTALSPLVAMTSASTSFTTSAQNGRVWMFGRLRVSNSGANTNYMYLYKDSAIWQEVCIQNLAAGEASQIGVAIPLPNDLAASTTYTFELRWAVSAGTATFADGGLYFVEFKR
jgi:hypothetical protein